MASSEPWLKVWASEMRGDPELAILLGLTGQMLLIHAWDLARDENTPYGELRLRDGQPYTPELFAAAIPGAPPIAKVRAWWNTVSVHYADVTLDGALFFRSLEKYQRGSQAAVRKARQRAKERDGARDSQRDGERDAVTPNVTGEVRGQKEQKTKEQSSARRVDPIWDAFDELMGPAPETKSGRGAWNAAAKELRDLDVDTRLIATAVAEHRRRWPNVDPVTPPSIAKHWTSLTSGARGNGSTPQPTEHEMGELAARAAERGFA